MAQYDSCMLHIMHDKLTSLSRSKTLQMGAMLPLLDVGASTGLHPIPATACRCARRAGEARCATQRAMLNLQLPG